MRLQMRIALAAAVTGLTLVGVGCREIVRPELEARSMAGSYVLESTSGLSAPVSGTFVLAADAQAQRLVRYPAKGSTPPRDYALVGTFVLRSPDAITFALRETCGNAVCIWDVHGTRSGERFTIAYPDALDGPPIVETYRRQ